MIRLAAIVLALCLALVASVFAGLAAAAEVEPEGSGDVSDAAGQLSVLRRVHDSGLRQAPLTAAIASGYGYTESVLGQQDRHHRLLGALLVEGAPLPWLGLGLRLDGRYDRHAFDDQRADDGWVGEPRLHARADRSLSPGLSAGLRAAVLFPGAQAPSWEPGATSGELLAMFSHTSERVAVTGNAGYRLDRSARSAMDARLYGPGDRLALGVSSFDAVLVGAAAQYRLAAWQLVGEWSWDVLVGQGAPAASAWPMRIAAGARTALSSSLDVELMLEGSPGGRPPMGAEAPLVPVPPRVGFLAGLVLPIGRPASARATTPAPPPPVDEGPRAPEPPAVSVTLANNTIPPDASVRLERGGEVRAFSEDGDGNWSVRGVGPGPATVVVNAPGFEESRTPVRVTPGKPLSIEVTLNRSLPSGQVRGTVRSFDGRTVAATIVVTPTDGATTPETELRSEGGVFQTDVPPGRYQVVIEAPGHAAQTRTVVVERNGVTVLNIDLRRAR